MILNADEKQGFVALDKQLILNNSQYMRDQNTYLSKYDDLEDRFGVNSQTMVVRGASLEEINLYIDSVVQQVGVYNYKSTIAQDVDAPLSIPSFTRNILDAFEPILEKNSLGPWALEYQEGGLDIAYLNAFQELVQPYWEKANVAYYLAENRVSDSMIDIASEKLYTESLDSSLLSLGINFSSDTPTGLENVILAESAMFLNMSPEEKQIYSTLQSRSEQLDLLGISSSQKSQSLDNTGTAGLSAFANEGKTSVEAWGNPDQLGVDSRWNVSGPGRTLQDYNADVDSAYAPYVSLLSGRDVVSEFNYAFEASTSYFNFVQIDEVLNPIIRLYTGILGRSPEKEGVEYWASEINNGKNLEGLASAFLNSDEFNENINEPGIVGIVKALYNNVLDRELDQEGFDYWVNQFESGQLNAAQIALAFTNSDEYVEQSSSLVQASKISNWGINLEGLDTNELDFDLGGSATIGQAETIARIYTGILGRYPDKEGFDYWVDQISDGEDISVLADSFFYSNEFLGDISAPTNKQAVDALYLNVLDRTPDEAGYDFWLSELDSGEITFGEAALAFTESDEYVEETADMIDSIVDALYTHGIQGVQVSLEDYILG